MNKLHSLIEHLKEQEKGYMDLLGSLSRFSLHVTSNDSGTINDQRMEDILDLSELNETLNSASKQQKKQQQQKQLLTNGQTKLTSK
jgi:hypothetical protein